MRDEERTDLARQARDGDSDAARKLETESGRRGEGVVGFLRELVGKWVYIEGIRINYRGILLEVLTHADGRASGLIGKWQRVSWFQRTGPEANYTFTHTKPTMIPYDCVHDIGEEGFLEGNWRQS